jgi:hypothetical protein
MFLPLAALLANHRAALRLIFASQRLMLIASMNRPATAF